MKMKNYFGACSITLRHDVGERAFLYGGIGARIVRSELFADADTTVTVTIPPAVLVVVNGSQKTNRNKWRFLTQAFAGIGVYLNENWELTAGYRLQYTLGSFCDSAKNDAVGLEFSESVKQDMLHAAEIGLTYRF